jgi:hypothetical protein
VEPTELLTYATGVFERLQVVYAVVGSMASSYFGEARLTNDVDILADLRLEHVDPLLAAFPSDTYYLSDDAIREAISSGGQFNIIHPEAGLKVDVMLPHDLSYDLQRLARRVPGRLIGAAAPAFFASPEDVIVKKLEFHLEGGSDKHIRDIAGILKSGLKPVDVAYVERFAEQIGNLDGWREAQRRAGHPTTA